MEHEKREVCYSPGPISRNRALSPVSLQQVDLAGGELISQQSLVAAPVFVGQEDVLAVVAAVGDVMRYVHRHHPRLAGHPSIRPLSSHISAALRLRPIFVLFGAKRPHFGPLTGSVRGSTLVSTPSKVLPVLQRLLHTQESSW